MKKGRITIGIYMIMRMMVRHRIVFVLMVVIPFVFLSVVEATTSERILPFRLASLEDEVWVEITEKGTSFIFFAVASAGFLLSFFALNVVQKNWEVNRRLIICGYHPAQLLMSILFSLILMVVGVAFYIALLTMGFHPIEHFWLFLFGLIQIGLVYGAYGLLVGSLIKGELEGILLIVLLVNIDVGWLQNPLFYEEAQNQALIRYLPAYYPSQTSIIAAHTDYGITKSSMYSLLYAIVFLLASLIVYFFKMRIRK